jgi:hypothetical protein
VPTLGSVRGTAQTKPRFHDTTGATCSRATATRSGLRPRTVATGVSYCLWRSHSCDRQMSDQFNKLDRSAPLRTPSSNRFRVYRPIACLILCGPGFRSIILLRTSGYCTYRIYFIWTIPPAWVGRQQRLLACLIVAPQRGYDEPAILSYAISSFCPTSADGLQPTPAVRIWFPRYYLRRAAGFILSGESRKSKARG